jgi:hypothetical protein
MTTARAPVLTHRAGPPPRRLKESPYRLAPAIPSLPNLYRSPYGKRPGLGSGIACSMRRRNPLHRQSPSRRHSREAPEWRLGDNTMLAPPNIYRRGPRFSDTYLNRILDMPRPLRTLEDWQRQRHQDLPYASDDELGREMYLCRHRRALDSDPARGTWLAERETAIRDELRRRGVRR